MKFVPPFPIPKTMPKFAANLHYLFSEVPFLDRFEAAARAGFKGVEFQVPYDHPPAEMAARLMAHGLKMVLFDAPMGNWDAGDRGLAAVPGREKEFRDSFARVVEYGHGYTTQGMHGYFLNHTEPARRILEQVGSRNLYLHLDVYHMQMLEGHLAETIEANIGLTRHFQIAGVPGRHEPTVGEINYPYLFDLLDSLGYQGWIGCEYRPRGNTWEGLGWAARYGIRAPEALPAT